MLLGEKKSLPSRGAWIEILNKPKVSLSLKVAPLAGSVDRNEIGGQTYTDGHLSLPSRGAWIEITRYDLEYGHYDRRSPRGERG